jgi:hypothetical protein
MFTTQIADIDLEARLGAVRTSDLNIAAGTAPEFRGEELRLFPAPLAAYER